VFEGGAKTAIQRGNGLMVKKSDKSREFAASVFIKWFTAPEQNIRFVAETGYMPVTGEAFETLMPQTMETAENPHIRQMLEAVTEMYAEYDFFVAPTFETFDAISKDYEKQYKSLLAEQREAVLAGGMADEAGALADFIAKLKK
jgi:multiple sugar transport system substrate-binding protein